MSKAKRTARSAGRRRRPFGPAELWKGYDPRREPFDEDVRAEWTKDRCRYRELYFTGETHDGAPVRVYAIYAAPTGKKNLPGILHVHGGGQTVDPAWLRFWTRRGYAALSIDWGGYRPGRSKYTLWNLLEQGNHLKFFNDCCVDPAPQVNSWYHWTLACRRALTYLERQPEVDPKRLGAFGISMGGTLMWNLAIDKRLKAGCAIYGVGQNTWRNDPKYEIGRVPRKLDAAEQLWVDCLAPESYAPLVRFPMLFLSATNDTHGNMDRAYDTIAAIPKGVPRCQAFTPRFNHHVGTAESRNLPLWMDTWLKGRGRWPATPRTRVRLDADGTPVFTVTPDASQAVRKVEMFYAVENPWVANRHWRDVKCRKAAGGAAWSARLPVMDVTQYLFAFANVHYRSGACISSGLEAVIPAALGAAKATDSPSTALFDGSDGLAGFLEYCRGTEPRPPFRAYMRLAKGPGGTRGIAIRPAACTFTYKIGDPKWRAPDGAVLRFDVAAAEPEELLVHVRRHALLPGGKEYTAKVRARASHGWRTIRLEPGDFKERDSRAPLESWSDLQMLEVRRSGGSKGELMIANVRWES